MLECCLKVFSLTEMVTGDNLGQWSTEPLHYAVGRRRARSGEAVLDAKVGAQTMELVIAAGIADGGQTVD